MNDILCGRFTMETCGEQFRLSTDSMVLADFAAVKAGDAVCDLGCGCGALSLLLCGKEDTCRVTGIEIQSAAAETARKNAAKNDLSDRFSVIEGDLRLWRDSMRPGSFDIVISNPPYFPVGSGAKNASESLAVARTEQCCTLPDLCRAAAGLLRFGGSFSLVHKPERLCDLFCALRSCELEPKRLRFVRHHAGGSISLVLVEARLGGKAGLTILPDLCLFTPDGTISADYQRIYHLQEGL